MHLYITVLWTVCPFFSKNKNSSYNLQHSCRAGLLWWRANVVEEFCNVLVGGSCCCCLIFLCCNIVAWWMRWSFLTWCCCCCCHGILTKGHGALTRCGSCSGIIIIVILWLSGITGHLQPGSDLQRGRLVRVVIILQHHFWDILYCFTWCQVIVLYGTCCLVIFLYCTCCLVNWTKLMIVVFESYNSMSINVWSQGWGFHLWICILDCIRPLCCVRARAGVNVVFIAVVFIVITL